MIFDIEKEKPERLPGLTGFSWRLRDADRLPYAKRRAQRDAAVRRDDRLWGYVAEFARYAIDRRVGVAAHCV